MSIDRACGRGHASRKQLWSYIWSFARFETCAVSHPRACLATRPMLHATLPILPACGSCTSSGYPVTAGALLTHASLAQLAVWQGAMRTGSRRRSRTRPYCCAAFAARAPASRFRDGFNKFFQPSSASTRAKRAERLCMVLRCAARLRVCLRVRDVERLGRMVPITNHPHFTRRCVNAAAQTICPRAAHRTHGRRARADNTHAAARHRCVRARLYPEYTPTPVPPMFRRRRWRRPRTRRARPRAGRAARRAAGVWTRPASCARAAQSAAWGATNAARRAGDDARREAGQAGSAGGARATRSTCVREG